MTIDEVSQSEELIEIGRRAVEDILIEMRDSRMSIHGCGNGFVCREKDGTPSPLIRMSTRDGLRAALKAIAKHVKGGAE